MKSKTESADLASWVGSLDYVNWRLKLIVTKLAKFNKNHPKLVLVFKVLVVFGLFFASTWRRIDPDFGWHLQAGNYIRHHGIPSHDVFTFTARDFPWIDHEWGNDIFVSLFYGLGGYLLLVYLYSAIWTLALFINGRRSLVTLMLANIAMQPYSGIRPIGWSILGLCLLLRLSTSQNPKAKWLIPLLFIIWANLHGGFVIGLAYLGYLVIKERHSLWLKIFVLSGLATFVNPYGPRLYVEIARTLLDGRLHWQIVEWRPFLVFWQSVPFLAVWMVGFWLYSRRQLKEWFSFNVLLFAAGMSSSRHIPVFVAASTDKVDDYGRQLRESIPKKLDVPRQIVLGTMAVLFVGLFCYSTYLSFFPWKSSRESGYPNQAISYLQAHPCPGNLFNAYNFGGYLIWKLPSQPVYIDGRMPSWRNSNGVKYFDIYQQVYTDDNVQKSEFAKYNIHCALIGHAGHNYKVEHLINGLKSEHWRQVLITPDDILFEK